MQFALENFAESLESMQPCDSVLAGFSGGLDSVVLLHALHALQSQSRLPFTLRAVHVHHGLQVEASDWQAFCESFCEGLQIPLQTCEVRVQIGEPGSVVGLENAARDARYRAFSGALQDKETLLLAHHLDDQLETFLLRLLRGAGPRGLSGIPQYRLLGNNALFRPLLNFSRTSLEDYARGEKLEWIEDASNRDIRFDRNYCRHELLPLIHKRWPGYRDSWSKSMTLLGEADELLSELAELDLAAVSEPSAHKEPSASEEPSAHKEPSANEEPSANTELSAHKEPSANKEALASEKLVPGQSPIIDIGRLLQLSEARRRNVLRFWLARLGVSELGWNRLQQLSHEVVAAGSKLSAVLSADGVLLQRYKNKLYALRDLELLENSQQLDWPGDEQSCLCLPGNGSLQVAASVSTGIRADLRPALQIRYRQGGESCQLTGRPTKSLKKLLQENEVVPWLRNRLPLVYAGNELACIPGIGVAECFATQPGEPGLEITWQCPSFEFPT